MAVCSAQSLCCIVGGEGGGKWKEYGFHFIEELPQTSLGGGGGITVTVKVILLQICFSLLHTDFLFFYLMNQN